MNQITTTGNALPGFAETGNIKRLLERFRVEVYGHNDVAVSRHPNREERELLQRRNAELAQALRPIKLAKADQDKAAKHIALMLNGYPQLRNEKVDRLVAECLAGLMDMPLVAIAKACEAVRNDRIGDISPDRQPTGPRMVRIARGMIEDLTVEYAKINHVLTARRLLPAVMTPEQRSTMASKFRALGELLRGNLTETERKRVDAAAR